MYFITHLLLTYGLVQVAAAFKLPFYIPWVSATLDEDGQQPLVISAEEVSNRIAIIGAGAGGSSAAFWISKAKSSYGLDVEVDVFDSNPYIGGRECQLFNFCPMRLVGRRNGIRANHTNVVPGRIRVMSELQRLCLHSYKDTG